MSVAFVIPSYGREDLTSAIVAQLFNDSVSGSDIIVVDNAGTFVPRHDINLIKPRRNLGWLIATNLGMELAFGDTQRRAVVWLNNDVTVSPGFSEALSRPLESGAWMVGPLYDGINDAQWGASGLDLVSFAANDIVRDVAWLEGTCALISRECYERVGLMDAARFGWKGWGADLDYALRVHQAGGRIVVTEAAFLHHECGGTANTLGAGYHIGARREMSLSMRRRWGRRWGDRIGMDEKRAPTSLGRLRVRAEEYGGIPGRRLEIFRRMQEANRLLSLLRVAATESDNRRSDWSLAGPTA